MSTPCRLLVEGRPNYSGDIPIDVKCKNAREARQHAHADGGLFLYHVRDGAGGGKLPTCNTTQAHRCTITGLDQHLMTQADDGTASAAELIIEAVRCRSETLHGLQHALYYICRALLPCFWRAATDPPLRFPYARTSP